NKAIVAHPAAALTTICRTLDVGWFVTIFSHNRRSLLVTLRAADRWSRRFPLAPLVLALTMLGALIQILLVTIVVQVYKVIIIRIAKCNLSTTSHVTSNNTTANGVHDVCHENSRTNHTFNIAIQEESQLTMRLL